MQGGRLAWSTARLVLKRAAWARLAPDKEIDRMASDYGKLAQASAERVLRFRQERRSAQAR